MGGEGALLERWGEMRRLRRAEAERGAQEWPRGLVGPRCGSGWELEGGSVAPGGRG